VFSKQAWNLNLNLQVQVCGLSIPSMDAHQLGKTTASVSSYYIIIKALGGPSAGARFKEISIWNIDWYNNAQCAMGITFRIPYGDPIEQFEPFLWHSISALFDLLLRVGLSGITGFEL
jgi:hypothetical protein